MESRWGAQGVLDFLFEYRSTLGGNIDRALRRAFRIEPEDFDADFRRWLREKYLPELVKTGEPSYFGRRFFEQQGRDAEYFAPAVSPSGDLVAALGNPKDDVDVVLFDTRERQPLRNLTKGWSTQYQHISGQFISDRRRSGSDLAFSPDGNWLAAFAKREKGRSLVLVDVIHGGVDRVIDIDVQQPFAPKWSPDGRTVAFAGNRGGFFDIFTLDVEGGTVTNLTNDPRFDGGPVFSPDGRSIVYSSEVGAFQKLFRLELANPGSQRQLTRGEYSDIDPTFTKDGKTLFFTSDRNGFENVYALDLTNGEVRQHTNAVTGCFMPQVVERVDGTSALVYVGVWKGGFDLYRGDLDQQPALVETIPDIATLPPTPDATLQRYEPDIQVTINDENKERYRGFKLFLEDGDVGVGVTSDQLVVSQTRLTFSDYLGDKRLFVLLNSVASFSDFNVIYLNLARRLQWGVDIFDTRTFFVGITEEGRLQRRSAYRQTGARGFVIYPLDFYHRVEASLGYLRREYDFQNFVVDPQTNEIIPFIEPRTDTYPEVGLGFVGDTTVRDAMGAGLRPPLLPRGHLRTRRRRRRSAGHHQHRLRCDQRLGDTRLPPVPADQPPGANRLPALRRRQLAGEPQRLLLRRPRHRARLRLPRARRRPRLLHQPRAALPAHRRPGAPLHASSRGSAAASSSTSAAPGSTTPARASSSGTATKAGCRATTSEPGARSDVVLRLGLHRQPARPRAQLGLRQALGLQRDLRRRLRDHVLDRQPLLTAA